MNARTLIILLGSLAAAGFLFLMVAGLAVALVLSSSGGAGGAGGGGSYEPSFDTMPSMGGGFYEPGAAAGYVPTMQDLSGLLQQSQQQQGGIWRTRSGAVGNYDPNQNIGYISLPNGSMVSYGGG